MTVEIPIHPDFVAQKVDIETKKVDIEAKKVDIDELKNNYAKKLKNIGANRTTLVKLDRLLDEIKTGQVFGRNKVIQVLNISPAAASKFIAKLKDAGIIIAVEGQGKGKYRFYT